MAKAKKSGSRASAENSPAKLTDSIPSTALVPMGMPEGVKVKRRLTMPSLVLKKAGDSRILMIVDALRVSSVAGKKLANAVKLEDGTVKTHEDPATVCTVADTQSGEMFTWLVPSVCRSVFERDYPGASYVGNVFYVRNDGKREGKRHIDYTVAEVELPETKA